ncbi:MAG: trypsin-like peptidase domain-containing protein [Planctomycetaceae bacterium]
MLPLQLVVASALAWSGEPNGEVLEFTAEKRCEPCQRMSPIVHQLQRQGYPIRKIDADKNLDKVQRFGIQVLPTFVLFVNQREVDRIEGATPESNLIRLCSRIPAKPADSGDKPRPKRPESATQPAEISGDILDNVVVSSPPRQKNALEKKLSGQFGSSEKAPPARPAVVRGQHDETMLATAVAAASPLLGTVRIRVKDSRGENFGSGTIIDSRAGQALVLTCGHIFRHWDKSCAIEVDVFEGDKHKTYVATKGRHNLEADVGLVLIAADALPACRVASPETRIQKGLPVATVGCSDGERPTVKRQNITALNRYLGPDNIECSAVPVQGRSGGGLFTNDGLLIGVCMAADPRNHEGLYAGLKTIHEFLEGCQLAHLYRGAAPAAALGRDPGDRPQRGAPNNAADVAVASTAQPNVARTVREPAGAVETSKLNEPLPTDTGSRADIDPQEVLGSEIVIIIRSRDGQKGRASRVVMLNRASRKFLEYLTDEMDDQQALCETTLATARRQAPPTVAKRPVQQPRGAVPAAPSNSGDAFLRPQAPEEYRRKREPAVR